MTFNLNTCLWSRVRTFAASFIHAFMVLLLLAALIAQTKGIKFYNQQTSGACRGKRISLVRRPDSVYDVKCLDVRLARGRFLLGHIEAPIAARLFPLSCDVQVEMYSRLRIVARSNNFFYNNKNNLCVRLKVEVTYAKEIVMSHPKVLMMGTGLCGPALHRSWRCLVAVLADRCRT